MTKEHLLSRQQLLVAQGSFINGALEEIGLTLQVLENEAKSIVDRVEAVAHEICGHKEAEVTENPDSNAVEPETKEKAAIDSGLTAE